MVRQTWRMACEVERNAFLRSVCSESCALHARVLRDFHSKESRDDRNSEEYGVPRVTVPSELVKLFKSINKQMAHLDKRRPFEESALRLMMGGLGAIVGWLDEVHSDFIARCRDGAKRGWTE